MQPIEIPVFGAIGIVGLVFLVSRVLLAVGENASWIIAISFAALVLVLGWLMASSSKGMRTALAVVCIIGVLGVIAGGVISAAQGSRDYEKHEQEKPFVPADRNQPIPTSLPEN
jgi:general stress protein CsbA